MTTGESAGPASAYPTFSRPASTCLSAPNGASVIVVSPVLLWPSVLMVAYRSEGVTARAAVTMRSTTACGCETMTTCEPSTSTLPAPARWAMERTTSLPAALSPVATTAHDGNDFQAGGPDTSLNAAAATGRWVAASTAACSAGRSAAKTSRKRAGSTRNSGAVSPLGPVGYSRWTWAVPRRLSLEVAATSPSRSSVSGTNAATKTRPTTLAASVAALVMSAPA